MTTRRSRHTILLAGAAVSLALAGTLYAGPAWSGYANDPYHAAGAPAASDALLSIRWQTPVDLAPQFTGNDLLIHYGSPSITAANTVLVPVKTGATNGFEINAINGGTGATKWSVTTDYILPQHNWTPSYSPTQTPSGRLYYAGAGGTIYWRDTLDAAAPSAAHQVAFFGDANYSANPAGFNSSVFINTPITSDPSGNVYFGYRVSSATPLGAALSSSGIARIAPDGTATYTSAAAAAGSDAAITDNVMNCAPALSRDGSKVYMTVSVGGGNTAGDLVSLNSTTLAPLSHVRLKDVHSGSNAQLPDDGSASPTVGPDGDVYMGVLENPFPSNNDRGWLLHFSGDLSTQKTSGAFGWDDTASIVPKSMVPSYAGSSSYLLMTKYNNYAGVGGNGINKIAILDPNATEVDPVTGETVMKEVLTIAGVTPDDENPSFPGAVREWCINNAVVDPATDSILANSEDGKLYRWNLATNSFTQVITLTPGVGEAYTPTLVGPDGAVYAINNATLFSVVPEPTTGAILCIGAAIALLRRRS